MALHQGGPGSRDRRARARSTLATAAVALTAGLALSLPACSPGSSTPTSSSTSNTSSSAEQASTQTEGQAAQEAAAKPTQVAAVVNDEELTVHQVNALMQVLPSNGEEGSEALGRRALERLIDLTLARQRAGEWHLERQAAVVQQLEMGRREVLARAWADQVADQVPLPSAAEVRRYFDEHPRLFSKRRLFELAELWVDAPAPQHAELTERLRKLRDPAQLADQLRKGGTRVALVPQLRAAEQVPEAQLEAISKLKPGEFITLDGGPGFRLWWLVAASEQPVEWDQARPVIERLLMRDRRVERIEQELKALRDAARIRYDGRFTESASGQGVR